MFNYRSAGSLLIAMAGGALLAGCSNGSSSAGLPNTAARAAAAPDAVELANPCKNPKFPTICVKQGGKGTLVIQENCPTSPSQCGTVTWSTTIATKGLKGTFKPNPGNPTTETVTATKTVKPGRYTQHIGASCSKVPNCPADYPAHIIVLKAT